VGYKGAPPPDLYALIQASGADINKIELVNVGFDPRLLTEGKVDVYPVYKSNEPYLIKSWGYDVTLWDAADYGVPTLGLTYVTSDEILQNNPEMLARFLRASLKGIEYAESHVDEAMQIVLKYTGPEADPDHMKFMLESELQDLRGPVTDQYGLGWQSQEQWQALAEMLYENGVIASTDIVDQVFTTKILEMAAGQ
jgi:ABC-type nitrate/sulfonate/bicarbonate transport system substrate-binding protein